MAHIFLSQLKATLNNCIDELEHIGILDICNQLISETFPDKVIVHIQVIRSFA